MRSTLAAATRLRAHARHHVSLLPLIGLIPSFLLATYALTEPWARARVMLVWGISKSPGATLLVIVTLAGMVAASVSVAARGGRHGTAAVVHLATGSFMAIVAVSAFSMIRDAGVRLLGLVPLASIKPARGLVHFVIAGGLVLMLGIVELLLALHARRRARAAAGSS